MSAQPAKRIRLQIVSDVICPWCFIGKRSVERALPILAERGIDVDIEWLPFQLNPTMPVEGMDRKAFRSARFGSWESALAMDARAVQAGQAVGADFHYERQTRTPNTVAAHSLIRLASTEGGAELQARVVEALFAAYFTNGEDISDEVVLDRIGTDAGMAANAVDRSKLLQDEVRQIDQSLRSSGVDGVPSYIVGGRVLFSGATSVEGYVQSLADAVALPG